jgi:cysteinyl-tRNA synthetase, unknown class
MGAKRTTDEPGKALRRRDEPRPLYRLGVRLIVIAAGLLLLAFGWQPVERPALAPRDGLAIGNVRSWGYQLQNVQLRAVADGLDMLVVDYSRDGSEARVFTAAEIERLRTRADGSKRIVLAYLSIGEAENSWLGPENPEWKGNFPVRYWQRGWREIIMRPQVSLFGRIAEALQPANRPYLDRIIEAGFDGVYLDRVDAFDHWAAENKEAQAQMVGLVAAISTYAKRRRPGFLIVPQNGEELLRNADYRRVVDAVAKEDLVYGVKGDGQPNAAAEIRREIGDLSRASGVRRRVPDRSGQASRRAAAARVTGFHRPLRPTRPAPRAGVAFFGADGTSAHGSRLPPSPPPLRGRGQRPARCCDREFRILFRPRVRGSCLF